MLTRTRPRTSTVDVFLELREPSAHLELLAHEDHVAIIRQFVAGLAEAFGFGDPLCEDMKLAVTEAASNAIVHAYDGDPGPLRVDGLPMNGGLRVSVRDYGTGATLRPGDTEGLDGFGLELIGALAETVELEGSPGAGSTVHMRFEAPDAAPGRVAAAAPLTPVLRRVTAIAAAQAGFSIDRLSDALLLAETLAAHAGGHAVGDKVRVRLDDDGATLALRIGPLNSGGARRLLDDTHLPALGGVLERLADAVAIEDSETPGMLGEHLLLQLWPGPATGHGRRGE